MVPPAQPVDTGAQGHDLDARIEAEMDKRGISYALARAAITGDPGELYPAAPHTASPPGPPATPRYSRRGGRSFPEPTARDLEAAKPYEQPSAETVAKRQATTASGMQQVARQMGGHRYGQAVAKAEQLGISVDAALRLMDDQDAKRRRQRGA